MKIIGAMYGTHIKRNTIQKHGFHTEQKLNR